MPRTTNIMLDATSRDFSGGLDVADSELSLTSKFARVLDNVVVGLDGSLEIRQGCKLFSNLATISNFPIRDMQFFYRYLIAVNTRGEVFSVDGFGVATRIWDSTIAAAKRPGLTIWGGADNVTFGEFNGELVIMNGVDHPLVVTNILGIDYLADKATGANVFVPVGKVCAAFANHFVIADNYMLHFSERNASGTWFGDVGAQLVNRFDMRPYVPVGDTEILGLFPFKGFLLVSFREFIVPITLVENVAATPKLDIAIAGDSVINNYGAISPRVGKDIGDMELVADIVGVASVALSNFTKILSPDRPSRLVDPLLQPDINKLDLTTLRSSAFANYDRRLSAYTLFLPNDVSKYQKYVNGYMYRYIDRLNLKAWSRLKGWNWNASARSAQGNVFYSRFNDTRIFVQGDAKTSPLYSDYVGEQETFSDGTTFTDSTGLGPVSSIDASGVPINWVWELPWTDLKHRGLTKTLRYVILDTEGDQEFTLQVFIDDMYQKPNLGEPFKDTTVFTDGMGFSPVSTPQLTPALTMNFVGKDAGGYGVQKYGVTPFGGGNNTALRKITLMPTKFTTMKLRFSGKARGPLRFVAVTLLYQLGTIRRLP